MSYLKFNLLLSLSAWLHSKLPIQFSVTDGFGDVLALDVFGVFEVGDGSGDLADFIVGTSGQVELYNSLLEHHFSLFIQAAMFFDLSVGHDRIVCGADAESLLLSAAGLLHLGA